jgi:hypothetical protein
MTTKITDEPTGVPDEGTLWKVLTVDDSVAAPNRGPFKTPVKNLSATESQARLRANDEFFLNPRVAWQSRPYDVVLSAVDFTTAEPSVAVTNAAYINTVTGTSQTTAVSVTANYIYISTGSTWVEKSMTAAEEGYMVYDRTVKSHKVWTGSAWVVSEPVSVYDTVATLKAATGVQDGDIVHVTRHTAGSDTGGGTFMYDADGAGADDNGRVLTATGMGVGTWIRQGNVVNVRDFGAVGDGVTDDTTAFNNALTALRAAPEEAGQFYIPAGIYSLASTIDFTTTNGIRIIGDGAGKNAGNDSFPSQSSELLWAGANDTAMFRLHGSHNYVDGLTFNGGAKANGGIGIQVNREIGLGSGGTVYGQVVFEQCSIGIKFDASSSAADHSWFYIYFNECTSGIQVNQAQNVNYAGFMTQFGNTDIGFDFIGGGDLAVFYITSWEIDTLLKISGSGAVTGTNNATFRLGNIRIDQGNQTPTAQLVQSATSTRGIAQVFIDSCRYNAQNATDGIPVFDIAGDVQVIAKGISPISAGLDIVNFNNNGGGNYGSLELRECQIAGDLSATATWIGSASGDYRVSIKDCTVHDSNVVIPDQVHGSGDSGILAATSTQLLDIADGINVAAKWAGRQVWDSTNTRPVWAAGSAAGDVWVDHAGTTVHTPV